METCETVKEELGSIIENVESDTVRIVADSYTNNVEERVYVSYPGLPACYILHTVDAYVDGLPKGEFWTEGGDEYEGLGLGLGERCKLAVCCKKHYCKWVMRVRVQVQVQVRLEFCSCGVTVLQKLFWLHKGLKVKTLCFFELGYTI
ncbi:hypothetical protein HanPI659440_Chr10g0364911 [Helianthus annuus]|nr:hypothetical protein HanPI659440_Chr10g0364911 [Helianthus annuus]